MKSVSEENRAKLLSNSNTFVHCGRILTQGGVVYGFTEHDSMVIVEGENYYPGLFSLSTAAHTHTLAVTNMEASGPYSSTITRASIGRGLFEHATVRVFKVDAEDPTAGTIELMVGHVSDVSRSEFGYTFQFDDLRRLLDRVVTRSLTPTCDATFCDARCGLSIGLYSVAGTVTTAINQLNFTASALTNPDGYFTGGILRMTSGAAAGYSSDIKTYRSKTFTTHQMFPLDVSSGDTFTAVAGCGKTAEDCKGFNNFINFRGHPHIPGNDFMMKTL